MRDFAQVRADGTITEPVAADALKLLEVDEHGFDEVDRKLLRTIIDKFGGGPVGINSIAAAISEEKDAIEDIYEPFLIQIGFLDRTPQGARGHGAGLQLLWIDCTRKGFVVKKAGYRPTKISGLATYVPPRLSRTRISRSWSTRPTSGFFSARAFASATSSIPASPRRISRRRRRSRRSRRRASRRTTSISSSSARRRPT